MSGFALPKLRWLVLGALAAGGWAMTQEPPSKLRFIDRPERTAARPKADPTPRKDAAARPKAEIGRRQDTEVARPKVEVASRKEVPANRPKAELAAPKTAARTSAKEEPTPPRPIPVRSGAESRPRQPAAGLQAAGIPRTPIPEPRPVPAAKTASAKADAPAVSGRETLYTRSAASMHQRSTLAIEGSRQGGLREQFQSSASVAAGQLYQSFQALGWDDGVEVA